MVMRLLPNGGYEFEDQFGNVERVNQGPTIEARKPSFKENMVDLLTPYIGQDTSESLFGGKIAGPRADALTKMVNREGLLGVMPISAGVMSGGQAVKDFQEGNVASGIGNTAFAGLDLGLSGLGLRQAYKTARQANPTIGEAAAQTYKVGQLLRSPDGYKGAAGKPDAVSIPNQGKFAAMPIGPIEEAALAYMKKRGMDTSKFTEYPPFSEERAKFIAAAYDMMSHSPQNKDVKRAYDAMIQETMDQYNSLKNSGIDFTFMKEGMNDPYAASPALGYQDLVERGNLYVFPTDFGFGTSAAFDPKTNPLLTKVGKVGDKEDAVANDAFRAVHDVFGHFGSGNPFFRHKGEERAFLEHSRMYSPEAQGAMTSETRGQNSWLNFGPYGAANRTASTPNTIFADQKSGLMPEFTFKPEGMPDPDMAKDLLEYMKRFNN